MKIWVTGANGMLGRCVSARLSDAGVCSVGTDRELDIAEEQTVRHFAAIHQPTAIINCAAYTAVDAAETDESTAHRVNALGPNVLARISLERGMRFTHVSTDYVIADGAPEPHDELAAIGPCNAYGRTKAAGESLVAQTFINRANHAVVPDWYIVRTSWLFGSGTSSFVDTMWRLMLEREEIRVVDDQRGRPTYAKDLAALLVRTVAPGPGEEIPSGLWHFANADPTTWFGLASQLRSLLIAAGVPLAARNVMPVTTDEFPRPARRPKNTVLCTRKLESETGFLPRPWKLALEEYVKARILSEIRVDDAKP